MGNIYPYRLQLKDVVSLVIYTADNNEPAFVLT